MDFASSFSVSDVLIVTDIFPAREESIKGITGELVSTASKKNNHPNTIYIENINHLQSTLDAIVKPGDMVITIGAGNIWRFCQQYYEHLSSIQNL